MDNDQPEERRHEQRMPPKRVGFAHSLSANCRRLGAGVSISLISWSLLSGFAAAAEGQQDVAPARLHPMSEIRIKPTGSTISLTPIGQTSRVVSAAPVSPPHRSRIQPNPMTGDSLETLDQPIFAGSHTENVNGIATLPGAALTNDASVTGHPHIFSMRRVDLPSAVENSMQSLGEETQPGVDPAIAFSLSDTASVAITDIDDVASLPLLPLPTNRQWVAAIASESVAEQRAEQPGNRRVDNHLPIAKSPIPQTISAAKVNRLSTTHAGLSVTHGPTTVVARPAGFIKPAQATPPPSTKDRTPSDPVASMMKQIRDRYPNAHVVLAHADGRVFVRGNCQDRKEATTIIRLIRSQLLIPVDDQLVIR